MEQNFPRIVRPHPNLRGLYITYLLLLVWIGVLPWLIPLAILMPAGITLLISGGCFILVCLYVLWVRFYYRAMIFHLGPDGISWERGVLFHGSGIVPYSLISEIEIITGPLSRVFGLSSVRILTTRGNSATRAIMKIPGIVDPLTLKERILSLKQEASAIRER